MTLCNKCGCDLQVWKDTLLEEHKCWCPVWRCMLTCLKGCRYWNDGCKYEEIVEEDKKKLRRVIK